MGPTKSGRPVDLRLTDDDISYVIEVLRRNKISYHVMINDVHELIGTRRHKRSLTKVDAIEDFDYEIYHPVDEVRHHVNIMIHFRLPQSTMSIVDWTVGWYCDVTTWFRGETSNRSDVWREADSCFKDNEFEPRWARYLRRFPHSQSGVDCGGGEYLRICTGDVTKQWSCHWWGHS